MGVSGQRYAPAALYPRRKNPRYPWIGGWGWVGPLDAGTRRKILCPCRGSNLNRPIVQPVVRHYTAWATADIVKQCNLCNHSLSGISAHCRESCCQQLLICTNVIRGLCWELSQQWPLFLLLRSSAPRPLLHEYVPRLLRNNAFQQ
jgi:hypothetical protein